MEPWESSDEAKTSIWEQHAIYKPMGEPFKAYSHHVAMQVFPWNVVNVKLY